MRRRCAPGLRQGDPFLRPRFGSGWNFFGVRVILMLGFHGKHPPFSLSNVDEFSAFIIAYPRMPVKAWKELLSKQKIKMLFGQSAKGAGEKLPFLFSLLSYLFSGIVAWEI